MAAQTVQSAADSPAALQDWLHHDGSQPSVDASFGSSRKAAPPPGFPESIEGSMGWSGIDCDHTEIHVLQVTKKNREIENGLSSFLELELDGDEVNKERFPLPTLRSQLARCAHEVHHGKGVVIIRGLRPSRYSAEENTILFLALAGYIGDQRGVQSYKGAMLTHVTDSKSWTAPRESRHGVYTNACLPFHTDVGCEILAIQVRECAAEGGETCVVSSGAIYNDLVRSDPKAIHTLAKGDWPVQMSKQKPPFVLSPLLGYHDGRLVISVDPARLGPHHSAAYDSGIPDLTADQRDALAVLQQAAQKHQLRLRSRPGDIIFLNNLALLHGRESYNDDESSSRHLVRLWLRNQELGWSIPPSMKAPWDAVFGERAKTVLNRRYPCSPLPEFMEAKYSNGTAAFVAEDSEDTEEEG